MVYLAKGASSGGSHSVSSGSRSSVSSSKASSSSKSSSSSSKSSSTTKSSTSSKTTAKSSTSKTSGAKGKAATTKPVAAKGQKLGQGQTITHQHFHNYSPPAGSVVYYPQHSALDYLPWIFLFSQANSPHNAQATVVQPDGKQVQTTQDNGGFDGTLILEWAIMLAIIGAVLFGLWKLIKLALRKPATEAT